MLIIDLFIGLDGNFVCLFVCLSVCLLVCLSQVCFNAELIT